MRKPVKGQYELNPIAPPLWLNTWEEVIAFLDFAGVTKRPFDPRLQAKLCEEVRRDNPDKVTAWRVIRRMRAMQNGKG